MSSLGKHLATTAKHVVESWLTWVAVGAAAGTGLLFSAGLVASEPDPATAPSGLEIETAVARSEAQANAARVAEPAE